MCGAAFPALALFLKLVTQGMFAVTQGSRLFEILCFNGILFVMNNLVKLFFKLFYLRRGGQRTQANAAASLVNKVDRLIGKKSVRYIAVTELCCSFNCFVRYFNAVMRFVLSLIPFNIETVSETDGSPTVTG